MRHYFLLKKSILDVLKLLCISWIAKDQEWRVPLFSQNIESLVPFDASQWADEQAAETQNYFGFFHRAVHVQSFQSPCTCTARPVLPSEFTPFDRANQELQKAFLDESLGLAQKEPKLWPWKVSNTGFAFFLTHYPVTVGGQQPTRQHTAAAVSQLLFSAGGGLLSGCDLHPTPRTFMIYMLLYQNNLSK